MLPRWCGAVQKFGLVAPEVGLAVPGVARLCAITATLVRVHRSIAVAVSTSLVAVWRAAVAMVTALALLLVAIVAVRALAAALALVV